MRRYRTRGGSVKINLLLSEPPRYEGVSEEEQRLMMTAGVNLCPSIDYLERAWQDATPGQAGRAPLRRGRAALGGRLDAHRRRPLGDDDVHPVRAADEEDWKPTAPASATATPASSTWPASRPTSPARSLEREVLAPPDLERIFGLQGGSIFQGEQGLDQMAFMRPIPELAQYATPVDGLYLCGAGTHPGGGVMAASGHNAATRILKDRRARPLRLPPARGRLSAPHRGAAADIVPRRDGLRRGHRAAPRPATASGRARSPTAGRRRAGRSAAT